MSRSETAFKEHIDWTVRHGGVLGSPTATVRADRIETGQQFERLCELAEARLHCRRVKVRRRGSKLILEPR